MEHSNSQKWNIEIIIGVPELLFLHESKDGNTETNYMANEPERATQAKASHRRVQATPKSRLLVVRLLVIALFDQRVRPQVQGQNAAKHAFIKL